jgi:hypothetical protein
MLANVYHPVSSTSFPCNTPLTLPPSLQMLAVMCPKAARCNTNKLQRPIPD